MPTYLADILAPLFATLLLMLPVAQLTRKMGLVDLPDHRKQHSAATPLSGGMTFFLAVFGYLAIFGASSMALTLGGLCALIFVLGVTDDMMDLSARFRIIIQTIAALLMVFVGGLQIHSIGNIAFGEDITFSGWGSVAFTAMCTVGVINSINMIDGLDGLSGSIVTISFVALAYLALSVGDSGSAQILIACIGGLIGFLCFNSRILVNRARIFLGDAGSMLLGFLLLWFCIKLSQGEGAPLSPVVAGWIFGLPLVDTVSVMVGRMLRGESPLAANRDHFHHQLVDNGLSVGQTVLIMAGIHALIVSIGLAVNSIPSTEPYLFWGFVVMVVSHFFITPKLVNRFIKVDPTSSNAG